MKQELRKVVIYTDGACLGNPGPGGYGVVLLYNDRRKELSGGFFLTTNNRMEIMAAIAGLAALKTRCRATLYSDSQYLVNAMTKGWVERWKAKGWMRNKRERALNSDLWEKLLDLCRCHEVEFVWVRGHAENLENERCDLLARDAAQGQNLPPDTVYSESN
jgi:ribonuclease HI